MGTKDFKQLIEEATENTAQARENSEGVCQGCYKGAKLPNELLLKALYSLEMCEAYLSEVEPEDRTITEKETLYHVLGIIAEIRAELEKAGGSNG